MTGGRGGRLSGIVLVTAGLLAGALVSCGDQGQVGGAAPTATPTASPARTAPKSTAASGTPSTGSKPSVTVRPGASSERNLMPIVQHGARDRARVALTFDADLTAAMRRRLTDGRVRSYYNDALVRHLRELKVPATLFMTGLWMEQYPEQTRQLAADPLFELGTHTYDHRGFTPKCYGLGTVPRSAMLADVRRAVTILDRLDPRATRWFRFPGGCYDGTALHELAPAGVTAVGLDVPGADGFAKSGRSIVDQVLGNARNGSIVVLHLHGGDNAPYTDEAITPIVRGLRARGFDLVTVTELMSK